MSNYNTDCRIYKEFKDEILVDGVNVYNSEVVQFRLYTDPSVSDNSIFYVFPITAGMNLFGDYSVLNIKDCIAVISKEDISSMFNDEFKRSLNDSIYTNYSYINNEK